MKVLVISAAFPPMPAGEATNTYHLCQHLADRGLEVHVLTSVGSATDVDSRITVHPLMRRWSWAEAPRLARFLKKCSPDAVCMMYLGWIYRQQFMSTFVPTLAKAMCPGVPFVTRFENVSGAFLPANSYVSRAIRKGVDLCDSSGHVDYEYGTLLRDSDSIILLSSRHQAVLEAQLAGVSNKCVVIPPPSNMRMSPDHASTRERGRQLLGVPPGDFLIAYIGFIYEGKGIDTLLHAFQRVRLTRGDLRLAVIGGGIASGFPGRQNYVDEMRSLSRQLGIEEHVVWTGDYTSDSDDASTYLRAADVCVLPFDSGVKLNNSSFSSAAAHGLPIITTADEHVEPQFINRDNALLCEPKSADALAGAITTLVEDEGLRKRLEDGSLKLANQWYSWETAIDRTIDLFTRPRPGFERA